MSGLLTILDVDEYKNILPRIQSEPEKLDLDVFLSCSDFKKIKEYNFKKINNALKKKEINVVTFFIVYDKMMKLMNIILGLKVKVLNIVIFEEEEEQKLIFYTKKECREMFQVIKNTEVEQLMFSFELKIITPSFIESLVEEIEKLPKMTFLEDLSFELGQNDDLKRCEIESFSVIQKLTKFNNLSLRVSKATGKINTRFILMQYKIVFLEIRSSQFRWAVWFLIKESAKELVIDIKDVEDLKNIVPLCLVSYESIKLILQVSLSESSKKRRDCFKTMLTNNTEFELNDSSEKVFPFSQEEILYLRSQRYFEAE